MGLSRIKNYFKGILPLILGSFGYALWMVIYYVGLHVAKVITPFEIKNIFLLWTHCAGFMFAYRIIPDTKLRFTPSCIIIFILIILFNIIFFSDVFYWAILLFFAVGILHCIMFG